MAPIDTHPAPNVSVICSKSSGPEILCTRANTGVSFGLRHLNKASVRGIFDRWLVFDEMLPWVKRQEVSVNAPSRSVLKSIPPVIGKFGDSWQDPVYTVGRFTLHIFTGLLSTSPATAPGTDRGSRLHFIFQNHHHPTTLDTAVAAGVSTFPQPLKISQGKLKDILLVSNLTGGFYFRNSLLQPLAVGTVGHGSSKSNNSYACGQCSLGSSTSDSRKLSLRFRRVKLLASILGERLYAPDFFSEECMRFRLLSAQLRGRREL